MSTAQSCHVEPMPLRESANNTQSIEAMKHRRRVKMFKRAGMFNSTPGIQIERAITPEELKQAYGLVHEVFVEEGYILPQPQGMRIRVFEALPETATFIAKSEGRVVGVMSLVPDSHDLGLPSDQAFHSELDSLRRRGLRVGEVTNLVVAPEFRKTNVLLELSRCLFAHATYLKINELFIAVSPGHAMFFDTLLLFEPCGNRRNCSDTIIDMVEGRILSITDLEARAREGDSYLGDDAYLHDWFYAKNPHRHLTAIASQAAENQFLEIRHLRSLFVNSSNLLSRVTNQALDAIQARWGHELFANVFSDVELSAA